MRWELVDRAGIRHARCWFIAGRAGPRVDLRADAKPPLSRSADDELYSEPVPSLPNAAGNDVHTDAVPSLPDAAGDDLHVDEPEPSVPDSAGVDLHVDEPEPSVPDVANDGWERTYQFRRFARQ